MRLIELIPTPDTAPEVIRYLHDFCDRRLGKAVVFANDRPNFIANRIFLFSVMHTIKTMLAEGFTVEDVDALTGPLIGRPRMATFRLADFTGIDVCLYVAETLYRLVPDDEKREVYDPPRFLREMVARGIVGDKGGRGFYKKVKQQGSGAERLVLDLETMDYREPRVTAWPVLEEAWRIKDTGERIKRLLASDEPPGRFLWHTLSELFLYAAARIPEITGDIVSIDTTMKAGFNWELGIFEIWNKLGLEDTARRMQESGKALPPLVEKALASGEKAFYTEKDGALTFFDLHTSSHRPVAEPAGVVRLSSLRRAHRVIASNRGANLIDLGDGIVCLEFQSKANTLDTDVLRFLRETVADLDGKHAGLVIGNEGLNFSVGANLAMLLDHSRSGKFGEIEQMIGEAQSLFCALRDAPKPTVAAVFAQTLAGGCELAMHCARVQASAETYMGLVEVGAGLIPAAGGCKEMVRRYTEGFSPAGDLTPPTRDVFQRLGMAQVSGSAEEAREWRFLRPLDAITMNRDRLIADARRVALELAAAGSPPKTKVEILVGGNAVLAALQLEIYLMRESNYISSYDAHIGKKLANVLAGGPLSQPGFVSEEYLLGLEKEAFLSLCGEEKTQQRMEHILKTGKPLRN
jgi:3-hydroxyacyl-CoA dehydrogenase